MSVVELVVDDDPIDSLDVSGVLSAAGFEPIVVHEAEHALAVLDSRTDIAVLFTDIRLTGPQTEESSPSQRVGFNQLFLS